MSIFRCQENTPYVYSSESRDFQLLLHLYDCVINGVKFDIDTIPYVLDTSLCRSNMLELLQTKLGFFTSRKFNDDDIRYVLRAFPIMVKNKGSLKAIEQAVNVYLKIIKVNSQVTVSLEGGQLTYSTQVPDHTVIIGMNTALKDTTILNELMKYILPTGFGIYFYFYNDLSDVERFNADNNAKLLFVSENINSLVRTYEPGISSLGDDLISAVDTSVVANQQSNVTTNFRGILNEFIQNPVEGNIIILSSDSCEYVFKNDAWHKIRFLGVLDELPSSPSEYDVVALYNAESKSLNYLMYNGTTWVDNTEVLYVYKSFVLQGEDYE